MYLFQHNESQERTRFLKYDYMAHCTNIVFSRCVHIPFEKEKKCDEIFAFCLCVHYLKADLVIRISHGKKNPPNVERKFSLSCVRSS